MKGPVEDSRPVVNGHDEALARGIDPDGCQRESADPFEIHSTTGRDHGLNRQEPGLAADASPPLPASDRFFSTARASASALRALALASAASSGARFSARALSAAALAAVACSSSFLAAASWLVAAGRSAAGVGEGLVGGGLLLVGPGDGVAGRGDRQRGRPGDEPRHRPPPGARPPWRRRCGPVLLGPSRRGSRSRRGPGSARRPSAPACVSASAALAAASGVSAALSAAAAASSAGSWAVLSARAFSVAALALLQGVGRGLLGLGRLADRRVGRRLGRGRLRRELLGGLERRPRLAGRSDLRLERLVELLDRRVLLARRPARQPRPWPAPAPRGLGRPLRVLERRELLGQGIGLGLGGGQERGSPARAGRRSGRG